MLNSLDSISLRMTLFTLFTERRSEAFPVSFVDGAEGRKMFCVAGLRCENEARTMSVWNLISEKNISVVIMTDVTEVSFNFNIVHKIKNKI